MEDNKNKRIWVFVAYIDYVPFFSKLFDNHAQMKEFSSEHASISGYKTKGHYTSDYFDLTDTSLIDGVLEEFRKKAEEKMPKRRLERWTENASPMVDEKAIAFNEGVEQALAAIREITL